jgi:hypothetical protein
MVLVEKDRLEPFAAFFRGELRFGAFQSTKLASSLRRIWKLGDLLKFHFEPLHDGFPILSLVQYFVQEVYDDRSSLVAYAVNPSRQTSFESFD